MRPGIGSEPPSHRLVWKRLKAWIWFYARKWEMYGALVLNPTKAADFLNEFAFWRQQQAEAAPFQWLNPPMSICCCESVTHTERSVPYSKEIKEYKNRKLITLPWDHYFPAICSCKSVTRTLCIIMCERMQGDPMLPPRCPFLCSSKEISLLAAMHLKPPFLHAQLNWDQLNLATALERQSKLRAKPDPWKSFQLFH